MGKSSKSIRAGTWFFTIFGGIFLIVGLMVGAFSTKTVIKTAMTKNWQPVEARIHSANLKTSRSDDSTTYRAKGQYSYDWQGTSYRSDVLFFGKGTDSQRSYHARIVSEMNSHQASNRPMTAWVNPKRPSQSILYNKIRWVNFGLLMLFSTIFGAVGAGIVWGGRYAANVMRREDVRRSDNPKQPWLWKDKWQSHIIKNDSKTGFMFIAGFAVIWNLISLPIWFVVPVEVLEKGNYIILIALLFPFVGVCLAIWTYKSYNQWRRFKDTRFTLDFNPAGLGHSLQGYFSTQNNLPDDTNFAVTLSSIRKYYSGSGKNRRSSEDILWQDEQHIPLKVGRFGKLYRLPIRFKIPAKAKPSNWEDSDNIFLWRLSFKSKLTGADLDQNFEVPVFDPTKYEFALPESLPDERETDSTFEYQGSWQNTGVIYQQSPSSHYYYFPPARHKGLASSLTFMTVIFGGVAVADLFTDIPLGLTIIFGLIGLLLGYFSAYLWLHKTSVEAFQDGMSVRRGMFKGRFYDFARDDIDELTTESTMTAGEVKYYDIGVKLNDGKKVNLATNLLGKRDVESLVEKIKTDLGLGQRP